MPTESESQQFQVLMEFECPDCKEKVAHVTQVSDGREALLHPLPMCVTYDKLTPEQYAEVVRNSLR